MNKSMSPCLNATVSNDRNVALIFTGVNICIAVLASVSNSVALVAIWKGYTRNFKRTPKLLLSLFATNLVTVFVLVSFSMYLFIETFPRYCLFSAHLSAVAFLVLWSSTELFLVTLDRYFVIVNGVHYKLWKKHFPFLLVFEVMAMSGYSLFVYFSLCMLGCNFKLINLVCISSLITINMFVSFVVNFLLAKFVKMNLSLAGRTRNMEKSVVKTVNDITISEGICQAFVIVMMMLYIFSLTVLPSFENLNYIFLLFIQMFSLMKCGIVPLTYIFSNKRIIDSLC